MRHLYLNAKGFTLMELMIALAIFSMIIGGIVSAKFRQGEQNITQLQAAEMQQSARAAMFIIKRELRMAGFSDLVADNDEGITTATPNSITFSYVVDGSGTLDTIAYTLENNNIKREPNSSNKRDLAENISVLQFDYFDGSGNSLAATPADPSDIRSIQVTITSTLDAGHLPRDVDNTTRTLTTRVWLRNMGI